MASILPFLQAHPLLSGLLGLVLALAIVGLWYVVAHHLQLIVTTLICVAGAASGAVVFWRGIAGDLNDMIIIGAFLMVIFPIIYAQAIRRERKPAQISVTQVPGVVRPAGGSLPKR